MISVREIDPHQKQDSHRFIRLPYRLYAGHPQWVPPPLIDMRTFLNRDAHPYYEHSEGSFLLAEQGGEVVGRLAIFENKPYNRYQSKRQAHFYFFEAQEDQEIANALFEYAFEWARQRGLDQIIGPKGLGALDGYGMLVEGFEHRQMMTMMNYNYPYYPKMLESLGFRKEVDFVSCYLDIGKFEIPERVHRIADRVRKRGNLEILTLQNRRELRRWAAKVGKAYNQAFVNNWEYYPLTEREIKFILDAIQLVSDPRLLKLVVHEQDVVGFLFAFPDLSAALQRMKGRLLPFGALDLLLEMRRSKWVSLNGMGLLPEYHGVGGNALLYSEMYKSIHNSRFTHADLTQVAETAVEMRNDLINLGGQAYKNHRVFIKAL